MAEYVIQKKTKCEKCDGKGQWGVYPNSIYPPEPQDITWYPCRCKDGYLYEEVPVELTKIGSYITFSLASNEIEIDA